MEHTIEFWLPFPPSTNRLWRSVKGRVMRSAKYINWQKDAATCLQLQHLPRRVFGTYELEIKLSVAINKGDADNRIKAVHDLLGHNRMIVNDKFCRKTSVEWATIDHDCLVKLTGEIAYKDQWEFAAALANNQAARSRSRIVRSARDLR